VAFCKIYIIIKSSKQQISQRKINPNKGKEALKEPADVLKHSKEERERK
jgi:hypothetical protein